MKRELRILICLCLLVYMSALLAACAPQQAEAPRDLVWPLPPDKPRIKWLGMYSAARDVEERSQLLESLVGMDVGEVLSRPQGVAVDADENIYVADTVKSRIFVFDVKRKKLRFFGEGAQERPGKPIGIAVAPKSNMLLVTSSKRVIAYNLNTGDIKFVLGQQQGFFKNPVGVGVDDERGRIYVSDSKLNEIRVFDLTGRQTSTLATGGTKNEQVYFPSQVFVDREGKVYIADTMNFKIKIFGPDGSFIRAIGGIGDRPGLFSRPYGVAADSEGHIYVSDANFGNIQIFDQEGRLLLAFGNNGSGRGNFFIPMFLWVDKDDKIYVADSINHRVQVFQYLREQDSQVGDQKSESGIKK